MRGGLSKVRVNCWLAGDPDQGVDVYLPNTPALISTTVDQVGSRLLGRGYGVPPRARSLHAAMIANDALLVPDEAQLVAPLVEMLTQIQGCTKLANLPRTRVMQMTATPVGGGPYTYDLSDDPAIQERVRVKRRVRLVEVDSGLEERMVWETLSFLDDTPRAVLVFCHTVGMARSVHDRLRAKAEKRQFDLVLCTGRIRQHERRILLRGSIEPEIMVPRDRDKLARHRVLVATQGPEVGWDGDADYLVSQSAPLDCLRQRLGRLDRLGTFG
jgi:CRISPR-associated endonuclease/helicase Cas3